MTAARLPLDSGCLTLVDAMTKHKTWDVIDLGDVPENSPTIEFSCPNCGVEAELPYTGLPMAQVGAAIVFDVGGHEIPKKIKCRYCRRLFER